MEKYKKIVKIALVVILVIVGFKVVIFGRDMLTIKYVKEGINWIESYYTDNAYYPNEKEFINNFSKIKLLISRISYHPNSSSLNNNLEQDFSFEYKLPKERIGAIGTPRVGMFGYEGYYIVKPCRRTVPEYAFNRFNTETYTNSDDWIYTDIYSGEVYSVHNNLLNNSKSNGKISLLNGLIKPRIFTWSSDIKNGDAYLNWDLLRKEPKYKDKVFITNGNDIFSYNWDSINLKLDNPQKIGEIPASCSEYKF